MDEDRERHPDDAFTRVVREDPARRGLLYAGTETGLYVSFDDGASWRPFQRNLPATPITDLTVKNGDLVVATQGRAFWILDDLTPLRQWNESVPSSGPRLFAPRKAVRMQTERIDEEDEPLRGVGTNLPNGVIVNYWLSKTEAGGESAPRDPLRGKGHPFLLEPEAGEGGRPEGAGRARRGGEGPRQAARAEGGLNRFVWDMRVFKPTLVPKAVFNEGTKSPPKVGPGSYQVRLTAGGKDFHRRPPSSSRIRRGSRRPRT